MLFCIGIQILDELSEVHVYVVDCSNTIDRLSYFQEPCGDCVLIKSYLSTFWDSLES